MNGKIIDVCHNCSEIPLLKRDSILQKNNNHNQFIHERTLGIKTKIERKCLELVEIIQKNVPSKLLYS